MVRIQTTLFSSTKRLKLYSNTLTNVELNKLFTADTRDKVIRTRPAGRNSKDTYSWNFTNTGHYTVKSGYWAQINLLSDSMEHQEVLQPSLDSIYQQIWKLETSPKVKHFLWRCLNNALPVAENMRKRHIARDGRCSRCDGEKESVNHLLFQCHYARQVWAEANIHIPPGGKWSDFFYTNLYWVLNLKKEYPTEEVEEGFVPWLLWRIWKNRNEFVFRSIDYSTQASTRKAWEDAMERKDRIEGNMEEVKKPAAETPTVKWQPPDSMQFKCNTDGAWIKESELGGVGWILRNHHGLLVWAGARSMGAMRSAIETEAETMRWASQTLAGFGYKEVIFESDSLQLVKILNGEEEWWPVLEPILQDIAISLSAIDGSKVQYVPRGGNKLADRVAKETFTFMSFVPKLYSMVLVWLGSCLEADKPFVRQ